MHSTTVTGMDRMEFFCRDLRKQGARNIRVQLICCTSAGLQYRINWED